MRISFQLRPVHLGAAAQYIAAHNASIKRQIIRAQITSAILAGVALLVLVWVRSSGQLQWSEGLVVLIGALVAYLVSSYTIKRDYVRRVVAVASDNNPNFQRNVTYEIQADGLATTSDLGESSVRWSAIQHISEDTSYIYLSLPGTSTIVIPHNAFATTEQQQAFARELRSHIGKTS
ncbi:MAG TPA: YcxB family protein [Roseiflexaceae bacterium]|nr:YcxB family protein [Roseiflexaceae bacterium]